MSKYSETHHLNVDKDGRASVLVAVRLQDVEPQVARLFVLRVLDAAEAIAYLGPGMSLRPGQVIRPQTSGPCVHVDSADDDDPIEAQALGYACRHSSGQCPHLDAPEILCPLKDALYALREVARLRKVCEAEQEEQGRDMGAAAEQQRTQSPEAAAILSRIASRDAGPEPAEVPRPDYVLSPWPAPEPVEAPDPAAPEEVLPPDDVPVPPAADEPPAPPDEALEPPDSPTEVPPLEEETVFRDGMRWTEAELATIAPADGPTDAIRRYREAFPTSLRGDGSITTRLYIVRKKQPAISILDLAGVRVEVRLRSSPHYGRIGRVTRVNEAARELMVRFDDDPAAYWVSPEDVAAVEGS